MLSPAMIVTAFLTGWPSIIAVILNYVKRSEVRGTWLDSHFSWQIRTFWFALLWLAIGGVLFLPSSASRSPSPVVRHRHLGALPHHPRLARAFVAKGAAAVGGNAVKFLVADNLRRRRSMIRLIRAAFTLLHVRLPHAALAQQPLRIGIVTFLSGPAAGPFGVPARNGFELVAELMNAGSVPAPYAAKGFGGRAIELVVVDEAGGPQKQVAEFRNLAQRADLIVGYISSGDCLAIAPVAEELKKLTVLFDCGTPRIFEDASYKYVFGPGPPARWTTSPQRFTPSSAIRTSARLRASTRTTPGARTRGPTSRPR